MSSCPRCGSELPAGAKYCPSCGSPVTKTVWEEFSVSAGDLVGRVKELVHEGNIRRIVIKNEEGKLLLEIPMTLGLIGALLAPYLAALGVIAALATRCTIAVERVE